MWDFLRTHLILNFSYSLIYFYLVKVCDEYDACRSQWQHTKTEKTILCYINGVRSIEKALATFGKDGRFSKLVLFSLQVCVRFFCLSLFNISF
jgi:hypothetical protein